jgi:hypothetical protein
MRMPKQRHLSADERNHFGLLCEAVYANPFSADTGRLAWLIGEAVADTVSQAANYHRLIPALDARLSALAERGLDRLEDFAGDDLELMRRVFLFHCYQRFAERFDTLIGQPGEGRPRRLLAELDEALAG